MERLYDFYIQSEGGICTDTRNIIQDSFFIALVGENFNGNLYVEKALNEGCKFAVSSDEKFKDNPKVFYTKNTLQTLQDLARYHRSKFNIPVFGITGSNGKTTTKELLAAVLQQKYNLLYTKGNLNNHIGVPLTLLKITKDHDFALIEMGANKPGDIKELSEIAVPSHGVITNIGKAHIEGFGSLDGVIKTKTELYSNIKLNKGVIFVNRNEKYLSEHVEGYSNVEFYGDGTSISFSDVKYDELLALNIEDNLIQTNLFGKYNANNVLTAYKVGRYFNVEPNQIVEALENYTPTNNRSQTIKTSKGNQLILDAYNANPTSLNLAIDELLEKKCSKAFIIGEMLELGSISEEEHLKIYDKLSKSEVEAYFIGNSFLTVDTGPNVFANTSELINSGKLKGLANKTILIKGSRGVQLEDVVSYL